MSRWIRAVLILLMPIVIMIALNEYVRMTIKEEPFRTHGTTVINSKQKIKDKCTWICSYQTNYCKSNHVGFLKDKLAFTDKQYFGVINALMSTGNYGAANLFFLVFLFPIIIWFCIVKSLNIQDEINNLNKRQ